MLRRVNAALFEEDAGADIELVVKATNNDGVEAAQFDYDATVLNQAVVDGFPGCRFTVKSGTHQFRALVVFSPGAPATARYDLFQVNAAGGLTPVGKSVTNSGTPLIGFGIDGVGVEEEAGAGLRRKARKPSRPKRPKTMLTRRSVAAPSPAKAPQSPATGKSAARKAKPTRARTTARPKRRSRRIFKKKR